MRIIYLITKKPQTKQDKITIYYFRSDYIILKYNNT